jgi:hypothetical protein
MNSYDHVHVRVFCCICQRHITAAGLAAFQSAVGGLVDGEVYCRSCMETHLVRCRECSARFTSDAQGLCDDCLASEYATAG